jgi:hypothetical protein
MGLEAKRRTVHDPRYPKTPKNEKRLTLLSKPFLLGESGTRCPGHAVRDTLSGTRCPGHAVRDTLLWGSKRNVAPSTTLGTPKPLKTRKGLLFQVNLFFGRKRNTLLWGSKRNVAPSTTHGTTKHINNEKRLTFSSKPFFGRKMGLEPTTLGTTNRCSNRLSYKLHFD